MDGMHLETDGWGDVSGETLGQFFIGWFCFLRKMQREVLYLEGTDKEALGFGHIKSMLNSTRKHFLPRKRSMEWSSVTSDKT